MDQQPTDIAYLAKNKILGVRWTKKKVIWTAIILLAVLAIGYRIFKPKNNAANIQTDVVKRQNLKSTVLATGQVVSGTDLELSFKTGGVVQTVKVKEGDTVKTGDTLASLEQKDALAGLTSARGSLAQAQANYNKVLAGASSQDITVAQVALDNAKTALAATKQQQDTAVANAYSSLLNTPFGAVAQSSNIGSAAVTISGSYTGQDQGVYNIVIYNSGTGQKFQVSGLEGASGDVKSMPVSLGTHGLYIQFSGTVFNNDGWTITIPNNLSSSYVANYNAYQAALKARDSAIAAAQNAVTSAQAALDLKTAQARPADVEGALAQILSAQGQVEAASAALDNTLIRAPAGGTVTSVDIKPGELATAMKEAVILQDVNNLHIEANVSEANIAQVKPDQTVDVTFDALGPDRHFTAKVQTVNPASTVVSGVVNYKVTASVGSITEIKPGMTANMTILAAEKGSVLAVPQSAIVSQNSRQFARVIDDPKKKTYHQVLVTTGLSADGGLVEILSGLSEGQSVVTFIKQ